MLYDIFLPKPFLQEFTDQLIEQRIFGEEVIGFVFLNRLTIDRNRQKLFPRSYIVPQRSEYDVQSRSQLALNGAISMQIINEYLSEGYSILHVHTHPGEQFPHFSSIDDEAERAYAKFLSSYNQKLLMFSAVFSEDFEQLNIRRWNTEMLLPEQDCAMRTSAFWSGVENASGVKQGKTKVSGPKQAEAKVLDRQSVFGSEFRNNLSNLRVALIGCGGVGSCFAELAARLGVVNWTLCDHDLIEESNLNRLPFSTRSDIGIHKVDYLESIIRRLWKREARIKKVREPVHLAANRKSLTGVDLLVCATDNDHSRVVTQEISSSYCIPMIDLAVDIDYSRESGVRALSRVTVPPLKGNSWSLVSIGRASVFQAEMERSPEKIQEEFKSSGYLKDVAVPAVYWLNSFVSATAVGLLHEWVINYRCLLEGVDIVNDFGSKEFVEVIREDDQCLFTAREGQGVFGMGRFNRIR